MKDIIKIVIFVINIAMSLFMLFGYLDPHRASPQWTYLTAMLIFICSAVAIYI